MNGDAIAECVVGMWEKLISLMPEGRLIRKSGLAAAITGLPVPALNAVVLQRERPSVDAVTALLDEVAATGLPHCLQLRPGSGTQLTGFAARRQLTLGGEMPVMALDRTAADRVAAAAEADVTVRELRPDEAPLHARIAAAAFGMTADQVLQLCSPEALRRGLIRCYVAEVDGQPVSTSMGVPDGAYTSISNVATLPGFRGRGLGKAVTARAVSDGLAAGSSWCWLRSSQEGYGIYEGLGFRTIETWRVWLNAAERDAAPSNVNGAE